MTGHAALRAVKLLHTVVWALLVAVILLIPVFAWQDQFAVVAVLAAIMAVEIAVLGFNGIRCPLTDVAGRYTEDRRANFDIYLPLWLAANNKRIFGSLFAAGLVFSIWRLAR